jgi:hypothetical protein
MAFVPSLAEVAPGGIYGDNERDLLDSEPAFDPFLTIDGRADIAEPLEVDEAVKFVAGCKLRAGAFLVLTNASVQAVGDAGV